MAKGFPRDNTVERFTKDLNEVMSNLQRGIFTPAETRKAAEEIIEDVPYGRFDVLRALDELTDWWRQHVDWFDD